MPELTTKDALLEKIAEQTTLMKANVQSVAPVGVVQAFAGSATPDGWLLCDGSAVSRTTYAALFAVIGTTYGSGNGSTTFNLPDLADKFIEGSSTSGTVKTAGVPNITGRVGFRKFNGDTAKVFYNDEGSFAQGTDIANPSNVIGSGSGSYNLSNLTFDASRSSSVYGNSTTVQPPAVTMRYIIKY